MSSYLEYKQGLFITFITIQRSSVFELQLSLETRLVVQLA